MNMHNPAHPGEIIQDILINGANLTVTSAAKKLGVNRTTLSRLFNGHSGISPDMALRLSKLLPKTDMRFWLSLQRDYDIWVTLKHSSRIHVSPIKAA